MQTIELTPFQQEEIAWKIEVAQTRLKEELTPLEKRISFNDLYVKIAGHRTRKRKKVTLTKDEVTWIQTEMSNALDLHGCPAYVGDRRAVGYSAMVNNLFKKLGVEYVDTLQAYKNEQ